MNHTIAKFVVFGMLATGFNTVAIADATSELFNLLDKGACLPSSLTDDSWTITTGSTGTHGELNWGDQLVFVQLTEATDISRKGQFQVLKNGIPWNSTRGWSGSCVRDGKLSLYVVTGEVMLDGCPHELAIGRLDHDDSLGNRVEVIFQDAINGEEGFCSHGEGEGESLRHPGHAHGDND